MDKLDFLIMLVGILIGIQIHLAFISTNDIPSKTVVYPTETSCILDSKDLCESKITKIWFVKE